MMMAAAAAAVPSTPAGRGGAGGGGGGAARPAAIPATLPPAKLEDAVLRLRDENMRLKQELHGVQDEKRRCVASRARRACGTGAMAATHSCS